MNLYQELSSLKEASFLELILPSMLNSTCKLKNVANTFFLNVSSKLVTGGVVDVVVFSNEFPSILCTGQRFI